MMFPDDMREATAQYKICLTPSMAYKERSNSLTSAVPYFFAKKD